MLPSQQHPYSDLPALSEAQLHGRREAVFLVFSGLFLGTLVMLNLLGLTRFIDLGFELAGQRVGLAVGVLPYPLTFLCTDFISEFWGRKRANQVVLMGLVLNLWVVFILWVGGAMPGFEAPGEEGAGTFYQIKALTFGAVAASMVAYLAAQLVDVWLFHFWKNLTGGKHLWLRNNGSTLVSQMVDTVSVILITHFYAHALPVDAAKAIWPQLFAFIAAGYVFKLVAALLDTAPFYVGSHYLARYLRFPPPGEDPDKIAA